MLFQTPTRQYLWCFLRENFKEKGTWNNLTWLTVGFVIFSCLKFKKLLLKVTDVIHVYLYVFYKTNCKEITFSKQIPVLKNPSSWESARLLSYENKTGTSLLRPTQHICNESMHYYIQIGKPLSESLSMSFWKIVQTVSGRQHWWWFWWQVAVWSCFFDIYNWSKTCLSSFPQDIVKTRPVKAQHCEKDDFARKAHEQINFKMEL